MKLNELKQAIVNMDSRIKWGLGGIGLLGLAYSQRRAITAFFKQGYSVKSNKEGFEIAPLRTEVERGNVEAHGNVSDPVSGANPRVKTGHVTARTGDINLGVTDNHRRP